MTDGTTRSLDRFPAQRDVGDTAHRDGLDRLRRRQCLGSQQHNDRRVDQTKDQTGTCQQRGDDVLSKQDQTDKRPNAGGRARLAQQADRAIKTKGSQRLQNRNNR